MELETSALEVTSKHWRTSADDLLVLRAPHEEFLARGPPADLAARLRTFHARTLSGRVNAEKLTKSLGFAQLLR